MGRSGGDTSDASVPPSTVPPGGLRQRVAECPRLPIQLSAGAERTDVLVLTDSGSNINLIDRAFLERQFPGIPHRAVNLDCHLSTGRTRVTAEVDLSVHLAAGQGVPKAACLPASFAVIADGSEDAVLGCTWMTDNNLAHLVEVATSGVTPDSRLQAEREHLVRESLAVPREEQPYVDPDLAAQVEALLDEFSDVFGPVGPEPARLGPVGLAGHWW